MLQRKQAVAKMSMLHHAKGFTLIELLIVVAIIGIIAAIAVPNLLTAIQRSKRSRSAADIRAIGTALGSYQTDNNIFPVKASDDLSTILYQSTLKTGMTNAYYEGSSKDGWGTAYEYSSDGTGYTLTSWGKNKGSSGTGDFDSDIIYINGAFGSPGSLVQKK
jgi:general secretion pathway protein G